MCNERELELIQTITTVMDPVRETSRRDWSLSTVFDRQLKNACPLAKESKINVDLDNAGDQYELKPSTYQLNNNSAIYDLTQELLDISMTWHYENSFQYRKVNNLFFFFFCL